MDKAQRWFTPCRWFWYKDPADIPARFWERYGLEKPAP